MIQKIKATLIQLGVGLILGLFLGVLLTSMFENMDTFGIDTMIYFTVMFVVTYIMHIVIHEGGHCLFGYLFGFEFVSFRVGSYMWVNDNGQIKFKRYKLAGTGGQCLMNPPKPNYKAYLFYLLGGGICNLIVGLLCLVLGMLTSDLLLDIFCFANIALGFMGGLLNLIPMDVGIPNDGYNAFYITKDKKSIDSLYKQLILSKELADGKKLEEMDDSLFTLYEDANLMNPLNTCIEANRGSRLSGQKKYKEAKECLEHLYQLNITEVYKNSVIYELLLIELLTSDQFNVDQYLTKKLKKKMSMEKSDISSLIVQYGIELLVNKDEKQAMIVLKYLNDAYKTYPYRGVLESIKESQKLLEERMNSND